MKRISKKNRTFENEPFEKFVAHLHRVIDPLLDLLLSRLNLLLTDTDSYHDANTAATFALDGHSRGCQYISQTTSATLTISVDVTRAALAEWPVGRLVTVVVYNGVGVDLTVAFSADFNSSGAVLVAGSTGSWTFRVKPPEMATPTATLMEV